MSEPGKPNDKTTEVYFRKEQIVGKQTFWNLEECQKSYTPSQQRALTVKNSSMNKDINL